LYFNHLIISAKLGFLPERKIPTLKIFPANGNIIKIVKTFTAIEAKSCQTGTSVKTNFPGITIKVEKGRKDAISAI